MGAGRAREGGGVGRGTGTGSQWGPLSPSVLSPFAGPLNFLVNLHPGLAATQE